MHAQGIRALDGIAARAMPADAVTELDGWLLRTSALPVGRANSVWPLDPGAGPLPARTEAVERHYAALGRRAAFQISPASQPSGLEQALDARGYDTGPPVLVQSLRLRTPAAATSPPAEVTLAPAAADIWLELWRATGGHGADTAVAAARTFARVAAPQAFATLALDGVPVAVGRGVVDGGWLGVFAMATLPSARRRGAAGAVLAALLGWGRTAGAAGAYLQCSHDNRAARALYAGLGFTTAYAYRYRRSGILQER